MQTHELIIIDVLREFSCDSMFDMCEVNQNIFITFNFTYNSPAVNMITNSEIKGDF